MRSLIDRRTAEIAIAFGLCAAWAIWHPLTRLPLGYDEIFTLTVARQSSGAEVVRALLRGADNHPPLDYLIRHWFVSVLGVSEWSARLPSVIAFALLLWGLFRYVRERSGAMEGFTAALLIVPTVLLPLAWQGRSYMLLAACPVWVFWCHRWRMEHRLALPGLGLLLAAAPYLHYYGLFLWPPLITAEVVRVCRRRRVDWRLTGVLFLAGTAVLTLTPFAQVARSYAGHFYTRNPVLFEIRWVYGDLLTPVARVACIPLLVCLLAWLARGRRDKAEATVMPIEEVVAVATLLATPVWVFLLAKTVTNAYEVRYTMITLVGVAVAAPLLARRIPWLPETLFAASLAGAGWTLAETAVSHAGPNPGPARAARLEAVLAESRLPIVVEDRYRLFPAAHYGRREWHERLYGLYYRESALKFSGWDTPDLAMKGLAPDFPVRLLDYRDFVARNPRFFIVFLEKKSRWLMPQLQEDRARMEPVRFSNGEEGFRVTMAGE